jgi:hypothetical protein
MRVIISLHLGLTPVREVILKNASFSIDGLSPEEVAVVAVAAGHALEQHRQGQAKSPAQTGNAPSPAGEIDEATAELAGRIYKGFTWHQLGPHYAAIFETLLDAPEDQAIKLESLATQLKSTVDEVKARLSKLSGRMKRIATPQEIARVKTPFTLFADIEYDGTSTQYRLTQAGHEAAKRYLGR